MKKNAKDIFYRFFDHLFLYITRRCNFNCSYCYMKEPIPEDMTLDMVNKVARFFGAIGTRFITVLGGEPTLHPNFIEIIESLSFHHFELIIDTNGSFSEKLLSQIDPRWISWLLFSLDSPIGLNYKLRKSKFELNITENIKKSIKLGFRVGLITTLSFANVSKIGDILKLAKSNGIKLVNFHRMMPQGKGKILSDLIIPPLEWISICHVIEQSAKKFNIDILYPPCFINPDNINQLVDLGYKGCTARSADRITLLPDGTINLCSLFLDSTYNFGYFDNGRISVNNKLNNEMIYEFTTANQCNTCSFKYASFFCHGGCQRYFEIVEDIGLSENCSQEYIIICPLWKIRACQQLY